MKVELPFRNLGDFTSLARRNLRNLIFALFILALCLLILSSGIQDFFLPTNFRSLRLVSFEWQLWVGVSVFKKNNFEHLLHLWFWVRSVGSVYLQHTHKIANAASKARKLKTPFDLSTKKYGFERFERSKPRSGNPKTLRKERMTNLSKKTFRIFCNVSDHKFQR